MAQLCAGLSVVGILFLTIVGILFSTQPFYTSPELQEDSAAAATQCYIAVRSVLSQQDQAGEPRAGLTSTVVSELRSQAGIYGASLILSLSGLYYDKRQARQQNARAAQYNDPISGE